VANALLFRPPTGIADPSELVVIGTARGDGGLNPLGYAAFLEVTRRTTSLSGVFAEGLFPRVMGLAPSGTATAEPVLGHTVTPNFFTVLGSTPARGRGFADGDESAAVLNYDYWRRRFNGDDSVVGRTLRINGRPVTVVGVAAPGFHGTGIQSCDLWLAIGSDGAGSVVAGGRLRPDVPVAAAAAEVKTIGDAIDRDRGAPTDQARRLNALAFSRAGGNRNVVFGFAGALMVLVSLVLAAACANVAGLMLTRASARAREIALRAALGAGRGRLVRQLLTETFVLYLFSGLLGIGLARVLTRLAMLMLPALPTSIVVPLTLDWRVLLFAVSLSVSAAVVFGVLPAFRGSSVDAGASLKDGVRSSSGRSHLRSAFVVGQIACSVLLVVLSASFVRVLRYAGAADPGFDPRGVDVATLDSSVAGEPNAAPAAFWRTVIDRVRQMPAVEGASLARVPPGGWEGIGLGGVAPGDQAGSPEMFSPAWNIVDTGYFATLRIPIVAGRDFAPTDTAGAPPVVVVSETLARRFWPGRSAIGKPLRLPPVSASDGRVEQRLAAVIGVAADIRSSSLIDGLAEPYVYVPVAQSYAMGAVGMTAQMSIVVRRRGGASLAAAMATLVQDIDQRLVLSRTESLADAIALGLAPQRILAAISGAMGLVALLLASMGIYGVTAYTVALRRREFAIRLALGAPRARVVRMVFRQGTWLVAVGLGVGLALAIGAGQVLSVFFYGLPAAHVPTLLGTVALFLAIGATASVVPAGQAVREGWRRALQED
jgi:predicted permease